jgi:hypothetical protein
MFSSNDKPVVAFPAAAAVAHSPAELHNQTRPSGRSARKPARQFATALFCAGVIGLDLGVWKMFPTEQEKYAAEEMAASAEEAAITKIAQASLANSKHPLLATQAREANHKIEQANARMQATVGALQELRTKRIRLIYLFCGIGSLLMVLGTLARLSA